MLLKAKVCCWWEMTGLILEWSPTNQEEAWHGCLIRLHGKVGGLLSCQAGFLAPGETSLTETVDFRCSCCESLMRSWIINNVNTTPKSREHLNHSQNNPWSLPRMSSGPLILFLKIYKLSWVIYKNCIKTTHVIEKRVFSLITQVKHAHCGKFRWQWKIKTEKVPNILSSYLSTARLCTDMHA